MSYRYPAHRILEIINAPKVLEDGQSAEPEKKGFKGFKGLSFQAYLELLNGPFVDLILRGKAGVSSEPPTYDANLFLDQLRVRGVGHNSVGRKNFRAKLRIPPGWHQNIVDPNKSTTDPEHNRHVPLDGFAQTVFRDFTRKVAELWNIDLGWEEGIV